MWQNGKQSYPILLLLVLVLVLVLHPPPHKSIWPRLGWARTARRREKQTQGLCLCRGRCCTEPFQKDGQDVPIDVPPPPPISSLPGILVNLAGSERPTVVWGYNRW
ncbi:hypothetical protein BP00DRAFT_422316 [Aspergillus indologenus CBS 114.80]|uniref:Secreted protein n=1 Tax=Aspergillus indologenus CBS 114.80 TaxID=1450541 RepID=A0A2V5J1H1_9EURO|nr:hypothetical protein BP00DRAFT_422316 [Aspergillus indologenus CBS 114.80]